jgi:hypothetical protein
MSNVNINYSTADKRFLMPYTYTTKRKLVRNVNPKPKTFLSLATQVLRARTRGVMAISWQNSVVEAVLSIEGTFVDCSLYRPENGNLVTIFAGTFPDVLRYVSMVSKSGTETHKTAIKNMQLNIQIAP